MLIAASLSAINHCRVIFRCCTILMLGFGFGVFFFVLLWTTEVEFGPLFFDGVEIEVVIGFALLGKSLLDSFVNFFLNEGS